MLKKMGNKGISTVFGTLLFIILIIGLASILFMTLYSYNYSVQGGIILEEERMQEKIVLSRLTIQNINGTEYVDKIYVNNVGSITTRIRAIYIDNQFLCDPSDDTINSDDTYINPKESLWINLPPTVKYQATSKMTVATERGIKSSEYESGLRQGVGNPPSSEVTRFYFGPLMLDFNKFYYTETDKTGAYNSSAWKPGWSIEIGTGSIAWNITVKNVDDRNITINQFSCLTLVPNDEPSDRRPWYIEPPALRFNQTILVNQTINIIYIWKTPKTKQMDPQSIYTTNCRNKVFLTFFGVFHEHDGTTKPYGQTIPFEAVLAVRTGGTIQLSASPTVILANSTMTSTITAKVYYKNGAPAANANVTFATDLGTLSKLWAITDANGVATVTLSPSILPGIANITATWQGLKETTSVTINGAPLALFTESAKTVYTGEAITFNASASYDPDGTIVTYFWNFGDGTNATGIVATHAYADNGVYTVTLTVTDNLGATASNSATKTVLNRPPVASFAESKETVLTKEVINFNASTSYDPDGTITSYFWTFGDGANATGKAVSHAYADNGIYTVTLKVTDNDGATASTTATKTVLNRPPTAAFTESATTAYTYETINFNATSSNDSDGSIVSYAWNLGDGNITTVTNPMITHAYTENGTYNVVLTVTDNDGATGTASATKTILNRAPVPSFTESASVVLTGEIITFYASGSYDPDGSIVSYYWNFGDGTNATGVTATHSYVDDGKYTVILTVTDNDAANASSSAIETVLNRPPVTLFEESAETVLTGETITFNASNSYDIDGIIVRYSWDFGDGTNVTGLTVDHTYMDNGTYMVKLTITDDDGAIDTANSTKNVLNRPPAAIFTESAETVFTGEPICFNASQSFDPDGTITSYFWDFGDGTNATGITVDHAYADNGTYTVVLTVEDNDGAVASTSTTETVLNQPPIASFTETATTVYTGEIIQFDASSSYDSDGTVVSYFWDFGDGANATGIMVSHAYAGEGVYTVTLTIMDDDGAVVTATATITVLLNT